jgi:hypothetical protein
MSRSEIAAAGDVDVIHPLDYGNYGKVMVYNPKTRVDLTKSIETLPFAFDNVFDETCTNVQIYERSVRHLIPSIFDGQWASVFAYGQTGVSTSVLEYSLHRYCICVCVVEQQQANDHGAENFVLTPNDLS